MRVLVLTGTLTLAALDATAARQYDTHLQTAPPPTLSPQDSSNPRPHHPVWVPTVASLLIPGTGQIIQDHPRGLAYIAAELWLLGAYVTNVSDGRRARDQYIDVAFYTARAPFQPSIRDTVFQYFEKMGQYLESGAFDTDPGPGFRPPEDASTYNGKVWALAAETFFSDPASVPDPNSPEYRAALAFYSARAIGPNFQWSWRGAEEAMQRYGEAVKTSDDAFRRSSQALGLIVANHLLSAADAFLSERLARRGMPATVNASLFRATPDARRPSVRVSLGIEF